MSNSFDLRSTHFYKGAKNSVGGAWPPAPHWLWAWQPLLPVLDVFGMGWVIIRPAHSPLTDGKSPPTRAWPSRVSARKPRPVTRISRERRPKVTRGDTFF